MSYSYILTYDTYVRVALAISDAQSILEIPATYEIHMEDLNMPCLALTEPNGIYNMREELHLNHVVPERSNERTP